MIIKENIFRYGPKNKIIKQGVLKFGKNKETIEMSGWHLELCGVLNVEKIIPLLMSKEEKHHPLTTVFR